MQHINFVALNFLYDKVQDTRTPARFTAVAEHFGGFDLGRHEVLDFIALMRERGRGGIILTGSMAGYMGAPSLATYCAAKAFSRVLTEALWAECQPMGVDVLHLVIGFTATPAMARLGIDLTLAQPPEEVAQEGLDNLTNGPVWIVGGEQNLQRVIDRSRVTDRAEAIRTLATPARANWRDLVPHRPGILVLGITVFADWLIRLEREDGLPRIVVRDLASGEEHAIAFAEENAIPINVTKRSPFSIDQNVWGRAVETGFLEHLWNAPTKDVYDYTEDPTVN